MAEGIERIVGRIAAALPERRAFVAVDGIGASGKSTFANNVVRFVVDRPVVVIHTDDFFHSAERRRARGRYSAEGFWLDAYDYDSLVTFALDPLRRGANTFVPATFDRTVGKVARASARDADENALVIVEGAFLQREQVNHYWDFSVFLDIDFSESARRMTERAGADVDDRILSRCHGAQRLYFSAARPWDRASLVIDNSDVQDPRTIEPALSFAATAVTR